MVRDGESGFKGGSKVGARCARIYGEIWGSLELANCFVTNAFSISGDRTFFHARHKRTASKFLLAAKRDRNPGGNISCINRVKEISCSKPHSLSLEGFSVEDDELSLPPS